MKEDPDFVEGKVIEVIKQKNRVYVRVEYTSKVNMLKFSELFQLTYKEFNESSLVAELELISQHINTTINDIIYLNKTFYARPSPCQSMLTTEFLLH